MLEEEEEEEDNAKELTEVSVDFKVVLFADSFISADREEPT